MEYKITIIIPVYNVEPYIEKCLQSVAAQTMTEGVECILVDDCGQDKSVDLAEIFLNNYKGNISFRIIRRKNNGGLSAARNTGINKANGNYLFFLDSDDEIYPDCLETMYAFVEKAADVDVVEGSCLLALDSNNKFRDFLLDKITDDRIMVKTSLLSYNNYMVAAQDRLVRRDLIIENGLYFKEGIIHEDNYWTFFLAKYVNKMAFCSRRKYLHRYNPNSITNKINIEKEILSYKIIIEDFSSHIDSFLIGSQKVLILNTLLTPLRQHYYKTIDDRNYLIETFAKRNTFIQKILLYLSLNLNNNFVKMKILHLLIRFYYFEN